MRTDIGLYGVLQLYDKVNLLKNTYLYFNDNNDSNNDKKIIAFFRV